MRTRSVSDFPFGFLLYSSELTPRAVAMLNGREGLGEELKTKFFVTPGFVESCNHADPNDNIHVSRKRPDGGSDVTEAPLSMWMDTVKSRTSADALRSAQIQVDQGVVVM